MLGYLSEGEVGPKGLLNARQQLAHHPARMVGKIFLVEFLLVYRVLICNIDWDVMAFNQKERMFNCLYRILNCPKVSLAITESNS